jgi:glycine/D-amino acid oxidase-like deaminating enzyme
MRIVSKGANWNPEAGWFNAANATASVVVDADAATWCGVVHLPSGASRLVVDGKERLKDVRINGRPAIRDELVVLVTGAWISILTSPTVNKLNMLDKDGVER